MGNSDLKKIWEKVPTDYYQKGTKKNLFQKTWHYLKINNALKILAQYKFNNLLDVGSASGHMLSQLAKAYPQGKYYGVDVYKDAIKFAKRKYPHINFRIAKAEKLPFKKNSFDLITFYEVIEHVQDPLQSLREIKRVLKKNGVCILAMDSGNLMFRVVWFIWENSYGQVWKEAHLHPFHNKDLEKLILKSGFKIKKKFFTHLGMEVVFVLGK